MSGVKKKAPKERDMSTIPRGSEALHPVKLNLLFIIGEKSAGMRGCCNLTRRREEVNIKAEPMMV
jgi:hypothetical protein